MVFPQYRKRFDNKAYYKITSFTTFEEILLIGKRFIFHVVHAKKYFEQLQVKNMVNMDIEMYEQSSEEEFEHQFTLAKKYLEDKKKEENK